jgi:hypothetical protein
MSHELALQKALIAHLKGDASLDALLNGRVWDAAPVEPDLPHLLIGRSESQPVDADGGGIEHALTLTGVSRFRGAEEAKAVLAAARARLADAVLEADGVRTANLRVAYADVFRGADGARTYAVLRVRAVTEEV